MTRFIRIQKAKVFSSALICIFFGLPITSHTQPAEIAVRVGGGLFIEDCLFGLDGLIEWRNSSTLTISARSQNLQDGATLGFVLYSPDGSITNISHFAASLDADWKSQTVYWSFTGGILDTGLVDRVLPDQFMTGGVAGPGGGFINPDFVDIMNVSFITGAIGTICIDSAFFPPSADWLMVPDGPPVWLGGGGDLSVGGSSPTAFCLTSVDAFGGEGPCFFPICPGALNVRAGDTLKYIITIDSDDPVAFNHTATTNGAGDLSIDSLGLVMYLASPADIGNVVFIDAGFTLPWPPFLCAEADTTVCNCVTGVIVLQARDCCDNPGDADHNGSVNIADVTYLIARIFGGGPEPFCVNEADANANGSVNIADITFLIARIFADGPAPACGSVL